MLKKKNSRSPNFENIQFALDAIKAGRRTYRKVAPEFLVACQTLLRRRLDKELESYEPLVLEVNRLKRKGKNLSFIVKKLVIKPTLLNQLVNAGFLSKE